MKANPQYIFTLRWKREQGFPVQYDVAVKRKDMDMNLRSAFGDMGTVCFTQP